MHSKRLIWIVLIIGLMLSNIGFAVMIGESFNTTLAIQDHSVNSSYSNEENFVLPDEEIPSGKAVIEDEEKSLGCPLYTVGLVITLTGIVLWKMK